MKKISVDVAVIGAGTAGLGAYRAAREHAEQVVMIEGGPYGTTCARVGCMPSKLLIAAAESAHTFKDAPEFGIDLTGSLHVDGVRVMDRVKRERDRFVGFVLESVESIPESDRIRGYAHFLNEHTLQVDDHTLIEAKATVIATGSVPFIPEVLRPLGDKVLVNDNVFSWDRLPESVAVIGIGVIGLELGQACHRLGVRTKVFGRGGRVGIFTDPELCQYSRKTFCEEMDLIPEARLKSARINDNDHVELTYLNSNGEEEVDTFEYILSAAGRTPNLLKLNLESTRLELNPQGVPFYDPYTMQCGNHSIFIAGDVNHELTLLHEASDEGRIAGKNAALFPNGVQPGKRRAPISVVFTDPNLATVGKLHDELPQGSFVTGKVSFENQGRSRVMLKNKGLLHVYADIVSGKFLGAEMIGPRAENIAHLLAWSCQQQLTIAEMLEMPFYHPVVEEGLRTALRDAAAQLAKSQSSPSAA